MALTGGGWEPEGVPSGTVLTQIGLSRAGVDGGRGVLASEAVVPGSGRPPATMLSGYLIYSRRQIDDGGRQIAPRLPTSCGTWHREVTSFHRMMAGDCSICLIAWS